MNLNAPENHPILTVTQLSNAIKHCLETSFPLVWLQGEISNCKPHTSGHLYFSLKDANSQISAVMFRPDVINLKVVPKDGTQVIVRGEINVYPMSGKYQILVREMRLVGIGELLLKLEELKIKLHKKGWFHSSRKKPLPKFPKTIGVVTSPTGAAIQDMVHVLTRRYSNFHLILNPVRVQGEGSAQEIAKAIEQFNVHNLIDVMIVGRGGGSIEDLWSFNEEIVAEAIFNSRIPIISAVGHETDHCIADYVADFRAPTPSAAAEIVIAEKAHQLTHLAQVKKRLQQTVFQLIRQDRHRLVGLVRHPVLYSPYGILGTWMQKLDTLQQDIESKWKQSLNSKRVLLNAKRELLHSLNPKTSLQMFRHKLTTLDKNIQASLKRQLHTMSIKLIPFAKTKLLDTACLRLLAQKKERLLNLKDSLDAINPKNLLTKGYCILFSEKDHSSINTIRSVEIEQKVQILLTDGSLQATVNKIIP